MTGAVQEVFVNSGDALQCTPISTQLTATTYLSNQCCAMLNLQTCTLMQHTTRTPIAKSDILQNPIHPAP
jgi:hypothetical protein